MWPTTSANLEKVKEVFRKENPGICCRCLLRYSGIKDIRMYTQIGTDPMVKNGKGDNDVDLEPETKRLRPDHTSEPCRACLGVLQEEFMEEALEKVCQSIVDCGYDADHFTIAISLPVSLALRSRSILIVLEEKIDTFDEDDIVPIKQIWKWLFSKRIEKRVEKKHVNGDFCQFYVELEVSIDEDAQELNILQSMCEKEYEMRQKKHKVYHMGLVTRQGAEKSLSNVSDKKFRQFYPVPPNALANPFYSKVTMYHNSIYLAGRYNKYSRSLPQTPWIVDGEKKMETSVEEIIMQQIQPAFTFDLAKFSSSGREDVDVRMLGKGRPFMFEVTNPRKTKFSRPELDDIAQKVNQSSSQVQIRDLQVVSKEEIKLLKEGEDQKRKTYTALCTIPSSDPLDVKAIKDKLESLPDIVLKQKTPIRVLHRRPNAVRERTVSGMKVTPLPDPNTFKLNLVTQAGTYVKEFVHGDFNRTCPNLRTILDCDIDIIALDVEAIDIDWPKPIN